MTQFESIFKLTVFMLYNFTHRRVGVFMASALTAYRKLVPIEPPRQEYLDSTRYGTVAIDADMHPVDEDFLAQVKRRKY